MKHIGIISIGMSVVLLSACGGGGGSSKTITEKLQERDYVLIVHGTKNSACSLMADGVKEEGVKGVIFDSPSNSVNCATYGKTGGSVGDENAECAETTLADFSEDEDISLLESTETACVIGGNA